VTFLKLKSSPHLERALRPSSQRGGVLVVVEDPRDAEGVADKIQSTAPTLWIERVATTFHARSELHGRPNTFRLIILDNQDAMHTMDDLRELQRLAPGVPLIVMNRHGPGAVLVADGRRHPAPESLPPELVTQLWRALRGKD
jgi:hypothetical protein